MALKEPQRSVGGLLALGKVKNNSTRILFEKINTLVIRRAATEEEFAMEEKL